MSVNSPINDGAWTRQDRWPTIGPMKQARVRPIPKRQRRRHFIKEWRTYRGYSQEKLADMTGLTQGYISQLERFLTDFTGETLEVLAEALMCDPADLLMRNPEDPDAIWSIWENASEAERRQIVTIAEALKRSSGS